MAIRMIEYDFAIGLEVAQNNGAPYKVKLPESCVIYLRHNDKTPDYLDADVTFDGKILPYRTTRRGGFQETDAIDHNDHGACV